MVEGSGSDRGERPSALYAALIALISRLPTVDAERVRWVRRTTNQVLASGATGLTMVELLVTVVILGLLGGIVVLTVGSLQDQSRAGACATERLSITAALESYRVGYGSYPTEAQLVAAGLLQVQSAAYDVSVQGDAYTLIPTGACADVPSTTTTTTTLAPTTTTSTSTTTTSTTTTLAPTTTTVAPTTTTTTPVVALTLSSTCTPWWHWPEDRAWRIYNPNSAGVSFTLEAVFAYHGYDNPIGDTAPPGYSTWYLPASNYGWNYATLDAAGTSSSAWNSNDTC